MALCSLQDKRLMAQQAYKVPEGLALAYFSSLLSSGQPEIFIIPESSMLSHPSGFAYQALPAWVPFPMWPVPVNVPLTFLLNFVTAFGESFTMLQQNLPLIPSCPSLGTCEPHSFSGRKAGWAMPNGHKCLIPHI